MNAHRFRRAVSHVVPADWRASVVRDLEDEAPSGRFGTVWLLWQYLKIGLRMRLSIAGSAASADLRDVLRSLIRARGFTAAAVLTFALGIGANIAVFSTFDRIMFRPLPYGDPGRLVQIHNLTMRSGHNAAAFLPAWISAVIADGAESIEGIGEARGVVVPVLASPGDAPLLLTKMTANALDVLDVRPVLGRRFTNEDQHSGERLVLVTHEVWQIRFGGSDRVLSTTWPGLGRPFRVIGVLPRGFLVPSSRLLERFDGVYIDPGAVGRPTDDAEIIGAPFARLRPGVSLEQARAEIDVLLSRQPEARLALLRRFTGGTGKVTLQPLRSGLTMMVRPYLWLASAAVWIILCVACVNLATLLLARGRSRDHEVAIRVAIGASHARLAVRALLEAAVLCTLSSIVALTFCAWTNTALIQIVPPWLRGFTVTPLDPRIVGVTIVAAFLSAALAGTAPALCVRRVDVLGMLQRGGQRLYEAPLRGGLALLVVEAAFGVALVVGAVTTVPRFLDLLLAWPGYSTDNLFAASIGHRAAGASVDETVTRAERVRTILDAVRSLPQVEGAAAALRPPFGRFAEDQQFWKTRGVDGRVWAVSDGFFSTIKGRMIAGREFSRDDVSGAQAVTIVSARAASALWPDQPIPEALHRTVATAGGERTVIGVVADLRRYPGDVETPTLFLPITAREQRPVQTALDVVIRMAPGAVPDPATFKTRLNDHFPPASVRVSAVADLLAPWLQGPRFLAILFASLAAIAMLLTVIGLFAVASLEVARRRYETGVRLALGASTRAVRWRIIRVVVGPTLIGAIGGLIATWWLGTIAQSVVVGVDLRDPRYYAVALCLMLAAALMSAWLPALRAGRIDPAAALRE